MSSMVSVSACSDSSSDHSMSSLLDCSGDGWADCPGVAMEVGEHSGEQVDDDGQHHEHGLVLLGYSETISVL